MFGVEQGIINVCVSLSLSLSIYIYIYIHKQRIHIISIYIYMCKLFRLKPRWLKRATVALPWAPFCLSHEGCGIAALYREEQYTPGRTTRPLREGLDYTIQKIIAWAIQKSSDALRKDDISTDKKSVKQWIHYIYTAEILTIMLVVASHIGRGVLDFGVPFRRLRESGKVDRLG